MQEVIPRDHQVNLENFFRVAPSRAYITLALNVSTLALTVISSYAAFGVIGAVVCTGMALFSNIVHLSETRDRIYPFLEDFGDSNAKNALIQLALSSFAGIFYFQSLLSIPCALITINALLIICESLEEN